MKTTAILRALALVLTLTSTALHSQVPQILNYQGRVTVGNPPVNFDGTGQFKFALVNNDGTTSYWSNDGTSVAGGQPTAAVSVAVTKGLYSVLLGDTSLANMVGVPSNVFANPQISLRVWFDDGTNGIQLLVPDQPIAAVGYAQFAANVADGAITANKLATGSVSDEKLSTTGVSPGSYSLATITVDAKGRITNAADNSTITTRVSALETNMASYVTHTYLTSELADYALLTQLSGYALIGGDNSFTGTNSFTDAKGNFSGTIKIQSNIEAAQASNAGTLRYNAGSLEYSDGNSWKILPTSFPVRVSASIAAGGSISFATTANTGNAYFPLITIWVADTSNTSHLGAADRNALGDLSYPTTFNYETSTVTVTNNSGAGRALHIISLSQ